MKAHEQKAILKETVSFIDKLKECSQYPIKADKVDILQLNVTKKCNLFCKHCHVQASSERTEVMSKEVLEKCLDLLKKTDISTIDITGGAPEMNPHLEWFINEVSKLKKRLIVRSNLVILSEEKYKRFIEIFANNNVELVGSVPDYIGEKSDLQRGCGSFDKAINIIKLLNEKGYGKVGSNLVLDLVHNPTGAYLPASQTSLEYEYKKKLYDKYKISFNNLFCITNMPLGRYLAYLKETDNYEDYMSDLINNFNPKAAENVMCKNTLSVSWDGKLYDCDFNQILNLPIKNQPTIDNLDIDSLKNREIVVQNHCFGCTAGSGSSCQGATNE